MAVRHIEARGDLGQHFLRSVHVAEQLVDLIAPWNPVIVLEIGAGLGTLSRAVLRRGYRLWAIEQDIRMLPALVQCQFEHGDNMVITIDDVRNVEFEELLGADVYAILSILPFDRILTKDILSDVIKRVPHFGVGFVVVPRAVVVDLQAVPGVNAEVVTSIEPSDFSPPASVPLAVVRIETRR